MPKYTGLKDFARGVKKLYKIHGNIPVFIGVVGEDTVAPFGIAIRQTSLLGGDAIVFKCGMTSRYISIHSQRTAVL